MDISRAPDSGPILNVMSLPPATARLPSLGRTSLMSPPLSTAAFPSSPNRVPPALYWLQVDCSESEGPCQEAIRLRQSTAGRCEAPDADPGECAAAVRGPRIFGDDDGGNRGGGGSGSGNRVPGLQNQGEPSCPRCRCCTGGRRGAGGAASASDVSRGSRGKESAAPT